MRLAFIHQYEWKSRVCTRSEVNPYGEIGSAPVVSGRCSGIEVAVRFWFGFNQVGGATL